MATVQDFVLRSLSDPKASQGIFDLPCGYLDDSGVLHREVAVREMTGNEEDMLASKNVPVAKKMNELITRCVSRIGTFTDAPQLAKIVQDLPVGDRMFLVFAIRQVSLGDDYPFKAACPECKKESIYNVLLSTLDIKAMPDPSKRVFDDVLPKSGKAFRYRILTGRDEERIGRLSKNDDTLSLAMQMRIELLDGKPPTLADLKALGIKDRNHIRKVFEDVEGGIDTTVDMTCEDCTHDFQTQLDVAQVGFFFPSAAQKA
jgi:hypothetical protein